MKISLKRKSPEAPQGPDIAGLITAVQLKLDTLERKIDTLISRAPQAQQPRHAQHHGERQPQRFDQPQPQRQGDAQQGNGFRERVLHKAICADCNKECQVPFQPTANRPVYCKECYARRRSGPPPAARQPREKQEQKGREVIYVQEHPFSKQKTGAAGKAADKKKPSARKRKR